ncbi:MAG TPA: YdeI/OmpD-associated family protein [Gemmatimonadaceae bacterium]|nr:YdeI/OmpD-associated family protein [Gemmatimonadaceae bacterium]
MRPKFFRSPAEFHAWMEKNHSKKKELLVGFYKVHTGKPSLTWSQSVDVALCYGWIDGIRPTGDEQSYVIRFTPRKPRSGWSAINIKKVAELKKAGLMRPAGLAAFEARDPTNAGYSVKSWPTTFPPQYERRFRANKKAWTYFMSQSPSRRKATIHWVTSAKREETRLRRLDTMIADCAKDRPNWPLKSPTT